jgi:chemotaxis protein methyltransferase CheR
MEHVAKNPADLEALLDRMTINVSQLWRNPEQWEVLAKEVLPELADAGQVRAWSAGSSYGAEAHTLGAVCCATIPSARVTILGTDIDHRMIERARNGLFSFDDARTAPQAELQRWFTKEADGWRASQQIRSLLKFEQGDLLRVQPRANSFDLVLCRNTVIYFSEPVRDDLHRRLAASLRPGGVLIVGNTERVSTPESMGLAQLRPFFYRKA